MKRRTMEKDEHSNDEREDGTIRAAGGGISEMKVARGGTKHLMLTPSHFESLPELAKWWTLVSDSIQHSKDDPSSQSTILIDAPWLNEFRTTIKNILQSRNIGDRERQLALTLASSMTSAFGTSWMDKDATFLQLVTSLAAIDVRMMLDQETMNEDADGDTQGMDAVYIARCCELLETSLQCAASVEEEALEDGGMVLTQSQALQINGTLLELTQFLLQYMVAMEERKMQMPNCVSYPLYRFICAYLGQGLALVGWDNLMAVAKPLFALNRNMTLEMKKEVEDGSDTTSMLLPVLYQLIEMDHQWNGVKKAFRDQGALCLLETYFREKPTKSQYDQEILELWKDL